MRRTHLLALIICSAAALHAQPTCPTLNPALTPEARAADLVSRMTLEEKVSQTLDRAAAIPRLCIPEYNWWNEGLHGVARSGFATVFPQAIGLAATFDPALIQQIGDAISTEARARHNIFVRRNRFDRYTGLTYWSPNINIFRDPRWGRGQETYGEDPFLTATTGVAFIRGLQGTDPTFYKVIATPKHFAVHSGPEPGRHSFNAAPSVFDLEDTYLPAFRAAIVEAHADSIMCAYNAVFGAPACASNLLLQHKLRTAWHFNGFVVSDCDAIADVAHGHHFAPDEPHASAASILAGTDLDCGSAYSALTAAVRNSLLTEAQLDTTLQRLFTARIRLGLFATTPYDALAENDLNTPAHAELALQAARESIVLLTNPHATLPLKPNTRIAVIGPTAELLQSNEGNYNGTSLTPVLPIDGLRQQFGAANVTYAPGAPLAEGMFTPIPSTAFPSGLTAEYFAQPNFATAPILTRTDRSINFDWDTVTPSPQIISNKFAVRWTANLLFPAPGLYKLHFRGIPRPRKTPDPTGESAPITNTQQTLRLYLDEKLLLDSATGKSEADFTAPTRGTHTLRIEYAHTTNERMVSLEWIPPTNALLADALAQARNADAIIAFIGLSPDLEGEQMSVHVPGFDGGDRTDLALPAPQQHLLEALKQTGKPLIVVLTSGSAIAANWAAQNADALLEAWYAGQSAGTAIAETIAGLNNPSGKLPITFYSSTTDLPPFTDYSMQNRTYRYFQGRPLFPFGFGLSYTTFAIEKSALTKSAITAGDPAHLTTTIRNTGNRSGDTIIQLYLKAPGEPATNHPALAAFQRVHLAAGESKSITLTINPRQLSRVDEQGNRTIRPGAYTLYTGDSQPTPTTTGTTLTIKGSQLLPE